ncbi:hypothetical protein HDU91_006359 [Kappamyces sp. JEL0680]|nr:hypothetical protein HDU91_006359 [Kappamyces sp. JEL0680]
MDNCRAINQFVSSIANHLPYPPHLNAFPGGALHLMSEKQDLEEWQAEISQMKEAGGVLDIDSWSKTEVDQRLNTRLRHCGAIHDRLAFRIRPAHLVWHLLSQAASSLTGGFAVRTHSIVERVESDAKTGILSLQLQAAGEDASPIQARQVVYTTNAYTNDLLPDANIVPIRNHVLVTKPIASLPFDFAITNNHGYEYLSPREDGRIILGGMRNLVSGLEVGESDESVTVPRISQALQEYLPQQFPDLQGRVEIDSSWVGIMGFTQDKLPMVGAVPGRPNEFMSLGFSGHGMPRCFLSSRSVALMMNGLEPESGFPRSFLPDGRYGIKKSSPDYSSPL